MNMLHHISLPVSDLNRSKILYDAVLLALGFMCVCLGSGFAGYGFEKDKDKFTLKQTDTTQIMSPGFHLAFGAPDHDAVDLFHKVALELGATCNGKPGFREHYGPSYYAAFIIDLDGHRIEAVSKE